MTESSSNGLGSHLVANTDEIVHRWYERWQRSSLRREDLSQAALKDLLGPQLHLIGQQLLDLERAEDPEQMWTITERLDPEERVGQDIAIEEVVLEYAIAVDVVRDWIEEREIDVPFREYSYFYASIFELVAESVRRYASHQAERVRADRAEYLAGVMHQLRTPLSVVAMQVDQLDPDAPATRTLKRNVGRVRALVDQILRLERFEPSELPVHPEEVAARDLAASIVADYRHDADRKGLRLEVDVDPALRMHVDKVLFADALGNFVHNAVKYTRAGRVRVDAVPGPDDVTVRVRDSGPGIPEEQRRTLFDRVQPGGAGGAGLGLRIAKRAARAMGGEVGVESEPGRGSLFWLRLPYRVRRREGAEQAA